MDSLNVYQRILHAKRIVAQSTFTKVKGEGLKFAYLPVDQVKPIVEDACIEAGIVIEYGELKTWNLREPWEAVSRTPYGDSKSYWMHIGGRMTVRIVNIDDPTDVSEETILGEAKDNSDKSISKLYTAIIKNYFKSKFLISESRKDDPDNTEDELKAEKAEAAARSKENIAKDPFFGKKPKAEVRESVGPATEKEADAVIRVEPPAPVAGITDDRPVDEMMKTIIKQGRKGQPGEGVFIAYKALKGEYIDQWTDEDVRECYRRIVAVGRGAQ